MISVPIYPCGTYEVKFLLGAEIFWVLTMNNETKILWGVVVSFQVGYIAQFYYSSTDSWSRGIELGTIP